MARNIFPLAFFPVLILAMNSHAADKLSCVELAMVADNLNDLATVFQSSLVIKEGDTVDEMFRDAIDDLHIIAASERERDLYTFVSGLENAWQDMDSGYMADSLQGVIESIDRLLRRDCYF